MLKWTILIYFLINIFFNNWIYALPNSTIINREGIKLLPAIVKNGKVFIQPFDGVNKEKFFYLLGNDGKMYDLEIKIKDVKEYKDINWGYGDNKAILLVGKLPQLPNGYLVASGDRSKSILKWYQAEIIDQKEKDFESETYISKDDSYGLKKQIIYNISATIRDKLYFASYRKLKIDQQSCDPKSYKETIGIIIGDGTGKAILNSFTDCDGQPKGIKNNYFPIGPILGTLEIKDKFKKEIWIVTEGQGYEVTGIAFIQYFPYSSFNKNRYNFISTDGL